MSAKAIFASADCRRFFVGASVGVGVDDSIEDWAFAPFRLCTLSFNGTFFLFTFFEFLGSWGFRASVVGVWFGSLLVTQMLFVWTKSAPMLGWNDKRSKNQYTHSHFFSGFVMLPHRITKPPVPLKSKAPTLLRVVVVARYMTSYFCFWSSGIWCRYLRCTWGSARILPLQGTEAFDTINLYSWLVSVSLFDEKCTHCGGTELAGSGAEQDQICFPPFFSALFFLDFWFFIEIMRSNEGAWLGMNITVPCVPSPLSLPLLRHQPR